MTRLDVILATFLVLLCTGCTGKHSASATVGGISTPAYVPQYASTFAIDTDTTTGAVLITTKAPWQGAADDSRQLLVTPDGKTVNDGDPQLSVLTTTPQRIVTMSSSHIAMLDALGVVDRVVGVSGMRFVSNESIKSRANEIVDVGYDGNIDYERLLACKPDLVTLYGVNGMSAMEPKLRELGIPYIYISDYLEENPLGKSEWVMVMAYILGIPQKGLEVLNPIIQQYNALCDTVRTATSSRPKVMFNLPYGEHWFMPPMGSYQARLVADAGGDYIYREGRGNTSEAIDTELAHSLVAQADVWLHPGQANDLASLTALAPKAMTARCVKTGRVYNNTLRDTPDGGSDYWESGVMNPHLILGDLVNILHPGLLPDSTLHYYKPLR